LTEGVLEGAVAPDAAYLVTSGVTDILEASEVIQDRTEIATDQPRRGFNGKRGEGPSARARRLRIERGEQLAPTHVVADVEFGRRRYVLCECGFGCGGQSNLAMAETFSRHSVPLSRANGARPTNYATEEAATI